jgi:hypothetical protein
MTSLASKCGCNPPIQSQISISLVKFAHFIYLYCMDYISVCGRNMLANSIILMTVYRVGTPCPRVVNNDTV